MDGAQLKALREANGWTLNQSADLMGLEPHVLAGVESGWRSLTAKQWAKISMRLQAVTRMAQRAKESGTLASEASPGVVYDETKPITDELRRTVMLPGAARPPMPPAAQRVDMIAPTDPEKIG